MFLLLDINATSKNEQIYILSNSRSKSHTNVLVACSIPWVYLQDHMNLVKKLCHSDNLIFFWFLLYTFNSFFIQIYRIVFMC